MRPEEVEEDEGVEVVDDGDAAGMDDEEEEGAAAVEGSVDASVAPFCSSSSPDNDGSCVRGKSGAPCDVAIIIH